MDPSQKPRDLVPKDGKNRHLSAPKQGDLTPETADKTLRPSRKRAEGESEDPISKGRGSFEIFLYGIMLLFVVGYQLFNYMDRESDGRLTEAPRVVAVEVDDRVEDARYERSGDRVEQPDCPSGRPVIEVEIEEIQGQVFGDPNLETDSINGEWLIRVQSLPLGGARITARATIDCEESP
ncbi:hypothetical protein J2T60_000489 [Natronospira proteinivora]|uniref:Uncharacterized protein n=1 Tax=Natronospira proteinivora TaxID=1807133 RepID=A0ABT1G5F1_9GAMM|nr:hypothetical protein [Natronospira proteinivora]MCP1726524.1 hypothetical protein [Natronospira proteinivora]